MTDEKKTFIIHTYLINETFSQKISKIHLGYIWAFTNFFTFFSLLSL